MTDDSVKPRPYGAPGEPPLRNVFRPPPGGSGELREKGWAPFHRLASWWFLMLVADVLFYVVLTPLWLGLRGAAWVAELRSRARRS